ncbi:hypothetical protein [Salmonella phage SD-1_S14]|nr:hypothetical protein [Salmonella phage SD-1_S14]
MEKYEIIYDYYGKAYMKCGRFVELSYKKVTIANFATYVNNPLFPYIIQYYCRVIK